MIDFFKFRDEFSDLIAKPLTEASCLRILEIIKYIGDSDDEVAHSMEDNFREVVLKQVDHPFAKLALKTSEFDFKRWCA